MSKNISEQQMFEQILHSIGLTSPIIDELAENDMMNGDSEINATTAASSNNSFDPLVLSALSEYAKRITTEILCDAKDYSSHAGHADIEVDDIKLAMKLYDSRTTGIDVRMKNLHDLKDALNGKPLPEIPIDYNERYAPKDSHLLNRTYTLVSGAEAYPKPSVDKWNNQQALFINSSSNSSSPNQLMLSKSTTDVRKHGIIVPNDKIQFNPSIQYSSLGSSLKADLNRSSLI